MIDAFFEYFLYIALLAVFALPLGLYIGKVMDGEKNALTFIFKPLENRIYRLIKINPENGMDYKKYALNVLAFSSVGLIFLFILLMCQGFLPGNPQHFSGLKWDLAFNTAVSFITNTNWQAYSGEASLSYLSQSIGLTVQNFLSAAVGIAVLFALIRGFVRTKSKDLGNFWADMTRIILYVLLPLNIAIAIMLSAGGVVQSFKPYDTASLLEPVAIGSDGIVIKDAVIKDNKVYVNDKEVSNAFVLTEQVIPLGPAASQIAIKQSGTNGGGFFGTNSAHPLENPTPFTNFIEMLSLLLIPAALCFTFGRNVKNTKQGAAIFAAMLICLAAALFIIAANEHSATPQLAQNGSVDISMRNQPGGNMEGKEARFGIVSSSTWTAFTTAASNGSVNSMLDSYTPLGGMMPMLLIQLGEVIFGGVGSGLYGMLAFAILTVFIAGLMVGRTPEFLGKKIEPYDMKWAVLVCLATPIAILIGSGVGAIVPEVSKSLANSGAHGFSEMLYAFSSAGGNNGSAFAGFNANTVFLNLSLGISMLFARFLPILGTLAVSGNLASKKKIATTAGTLSTTNGLFVFLLIFVVLLIGALSFFPALALGPIAEFFSSIA